MGCSADNSVNFSSLLILATWTILFGWAGTQVILCATGKFGPPSCTGTCHCMQGPQVCDNSDGSCADSYCSYGWTESPRCQKPCNYTFGPQCVHDCHCPVGDGCGPVNGLCSSGSCHPEWYGAGCQTRLPKLIASPRLVNITCGQVTVEWNAWVADFDNGKGPIHSYSVWQRREPTQPWRIIQQITEASVINYTIVVGVTDPEQEVQFRVDSNMLDDGKKVTGPPGVPSGRVVPTCITTTTSPSTPPPSTSRPSTTSKPTTSRPIDGRIFDTVNVGQVGLDFVYFNWTLAANVSEDSVRLMISYRQSAIGDCNNTFSDVITENINQSASSFLLDRLVAWRKYDVTVTAIGELNETDHVTLSVNTKEIAPTGTIEPSYIQATSLEPNSFSLSWSPMSCEERGGRLLYYEVNITDGDNGSVLKLIETDTESVTVEDLSPFSRYTVRVRYVNSVGAGDYGGAKTFMTAEDVPAAPVINSTRATTNSITVNWFEPVPPNGVIINYGLSYQEVGGLDSVAVLSNLNRQTSIPGLKAYTIYAIRIRAETRRGWSNFSVPVSVRTLQAVPGQPIIDSQPAFRNETCVQVSWQQPLEQNGVVQTYQVSYKQIITHHSKGLNSTEIFFTVSGTFTFAVICDLQPATYYGFQVRAKTEAGQGPSSEALHLWTIQGLPEPPPRPTVLSFNDTTITVELSSATVTTGPLTAYRVIIEKIETKRRRRASDIGIDLPGYVAGEFNPSEISSKTIFVVGDGVSYGGFENKVLEQNTVYDIAFVVISELVGLNKSSFSRIAKPVQTLLPGNPGPIAQGNALQTVGIIIGVLLAVLLVLIIIFICYIRRNNNKYYAFSAYNKENEKVSLSLYNEDDDLLKHWSKIKSFSQRRHVVSGVKYLQTRRGIHPKDEADIKASKNNPKSFISLHKEFYSLPHKKRPCVVANKRINKKHNRFEHLLPFDHSRVVLRPDENSDNDYINASYLDGFKRKDCYIAAMSPFNEETVMEFWRMIYQLRLPVVVMITKVEEEQFIKCTQYWPDVQGVVTFANFILQVEEVEEYADYVVRVISLKGREEKDIHTVRVFDYLSWPEHGIPSDPIPLLEMQRKVRSFVPFGYPLLVHCGTGVGRSGCYIAIDALLEQYHAENEVNVFQFVKRMRDNRPCMVRTIRQYAFIYDSLFEAVVVGDLYAGEDLKERYRDMISRNSKTGHTYLKDQFLSLQEFTPKLNKADCKAAFLPANVGKNRYPDLLPPDAYRPIINTLGGPDRTDYVNAVFLDGHRRKNNFILTQTPLPFTVLDFWKLVYDYKVTTIVMMEEKKEKKDHVQYWPDDDSPGLDIQPYMVENINSTAEGDDGQIFITSLRVHNLQNHRAQPREVRIFQLQSWTGPDFVPASKTVLLDLVDLVDDWQRFSSGDTTPVLVHCSDGATQSGLFCAISIICNKMLLEGSVDVYHTIKHLKRRRPQIVDQLEQYRFCYKTLWDFISLRLTEKSFSQGSVTQGDKLYGVPSLNLSLFSSIYDVENDDETFHDSRNPVHSNRSQNFTAIYEDGFI